MKTKIIIAGLFIALIAAFFIFDLGQYFSLDYLKEQKESLNQFYSDNPFLMIAVFFLIYVAVAALALPAATFAFYVFGLRLVPLFPFVVVNSVLGLTKLKTFTFYWASQLGMLAGTAVYVNAGTQLAEIETLGDIASPKLIFSFVLLGVFPIIAKKIMDLLKKNREVEQSDA